MSRPQNKLIAPSRRPEKLKDFSKETQELMPREWDKEANVFSEIPEKLLFSIDPSTIKCGGNFEPLIYQNNYFMWAIFNYPELARRMIVDDVDPNAQPVSYNDNYGPKIFGRQSPIFAALRYQADPLVVECLCMANANLDITQGEQRSGFAIDSSKAKKYFEPRRPLLSILYEKGKREYLNLAEQALLNHVYFATATQKLHAQLQPLLDSIISPPVVFPPIQIKYEISKIIFDYVCQENPSLTQLLTKADYSLAPGVNPNSWAAQLADNSAYRTSLIPSLHRLAKDYFENTQVVLNERAEYEMQVSSRNRIQARRNNNAPKKLKDLPTEAQELMPREWNKEAEVFSQIPIPVQPSSLLEAQETDKWKSYVQRMLYLDSQYEGSQKQNTNSNNYFLWSIFNHPELARQMVVAGVHTNTRYRRVGESPLFITMWINPSPQLVDCLCSSDVDFNVRQGEFTGNRKKTDNKEIEKLEKTRPLLSMIYEKGKKEYLNLAEQTLLNHVYFATATKALKTELEPLFTKVMAKEIFCIIFDYICEYNYKLARLLKKAHYQIVPVVECSDTPDNCMLQVSDESCDDECGKEYVVERGSLVEPFHQLARSYFENAQSIKEKRAESIRVAASRTENVAILHQHQIAVAPTNPNAKLTFSKTTPH